MEKTLDRYGLAQVVIKDAINGEAEIYIDGHRVTGVIGYKIEHCQLNLDCGAIPVLPEPWTWFYAPKVPNFTDVRDIPCKPE